MKGIEIIEKRRVRAGITAMVIVAFVFATFTLGLEQSHGATTYAYTGKKVAAVSGSTVTAFTVPALGLKGLCCQATTKMTTSGKAKLTRLSNNSDYAKVVYYWGIVKGYASKAQSSQEMKNLERMLQYITSPSATKDLYFVKYGYAKKAITAARSVKVPATMEVYKANPTNKSQDFIAWKYAKPSSLTLVKTSSDPAFSNLGGYSFAGIQYQVYRSDKKTKVGVLTCKANGTTNTLTNLPKGTYYAKEIKSNDHYVLNTAWLKVTVGEGKKGTFKATDNPQKGRVSLIKGSTDINSIGAGYDFDGIEYGVFASKSTSSTRLATLTLNSSGVSNVSGDIPVGTRYVKELKTNEYYKLSDTWYSVTVKAGTTVTLPDTVVMDEPISGTLTIVKKITGGEATDQVFKFDLINKTNSSIAYRGIEVVGNGTPVTLDVLAGDYVLRETDSGDYLDETGDQDITVRQNETVEVERTNRISRSGSLQVRKTTDDSGPKAGFRFKVTGTLQNEGTLTAEDFLREVDPAIEAVNEEIEFETGQWTVDEAGLKELNDGAKDHKTGDYIIGVKNKVETADGSVDIGVDVIVHLDPVELDDELVEYIPKATDHVRAQTTEGEFKVGFNDFNWRGSGTEYRDIITGEDHTILVTNSRGYGKREGSDEEGIYPAFPGVYTVTEIMTDDQQERYRQPEAQTKIWNGTGAGVFCFDFVNNAKAREVGLKKKSADGNVAGISFRLSGKTAFGDSIRKTGVTDSEGGIDFGKLAKGSYVIEEIGWDPDRYANNHRLDGYDRPAVEFTINGDETDELVIEFENVPLARMKITKQDKGTGLFLPGATFSLVNTTKNTAEATFRITEDEGYPKVEILNGASGIRVFSGDADPSAGIVEGADDESGDGDDDTDGGDGDDADDGGDVGDGDDETAGSDGEAEDEAEDNTNGGGEIGESGDKNWITLTGLTSGDRYKVMEVDSPKGYGIDEEPREFSADHAEPIEILFEDEQSRIKTTLTDSKTGDHVALAADDMKIVDTVAFENLVPGKEYRLEGVLMDKSQSLITDDTDDVVEAKDPTGKAIRASRTFTPETASGTVKVTFEFDGSELEGSTLVAYEKLYIDEGLVASHEDPSDEGQTIVIPSVKTTAIAEDTKMHITNASSKAVIIDTVTYSNLDIGVEYQVYGVLVDKATGEPIVAGGREVRADQTFTPQDSSGSVSLTFEVDARDLAGVTTVAFEELKFKGKTVAEHKDPNDPEQSVDIPLIETVADRMGKNRIEDKVKYSGLAAGEKYIMQGVLMDKATGEEIPGTAAEKEFIAKKSSGHVVIPFKISADDLLANGIEEVVAFEKCFVLTDLNDDGKTTPVEIASHRDIDDEGQTVDLRIPTKKTRTGEDTRLWLVLCIILMTTSMLGIVRVLSRRTS